MHFIVIHTLSIYKTDADIINICLKYQLAQNEPLRFPQFYRNPPRQFVLEKRKRKITDSELYYEC